MAAAVLTLAACSGSDTDVEASAPAAAIAAAAQETLDAGTARVTITVEYMRSDHTWEGVVDLERHLVGLEREGSRMVIYGTIAYFRDAGEVDERWQRFDLGRPRQPGALLLRRYDPTHLLRFLADKDFGPVDPMGQVEIHGTTTTRYLGIVENEALAGVLTPGITYEEIVTARAYPPDPIPEHTYLEAWVGANGRLQQVAYWYDAFGTDFGERVIVELYDFGAAVNVDVPSPKETVRG